jgi:hypothetical protein
MPMPLPRCAAVACSIALVVAGGGCGSNQEPATGGGSATAPAAAGERLEGTGYTIAVPDGWSDRTREFSGTAVNVDAAVAAAPEDGFASNVNVLRETPTGEPSLQDVVSTFREQLATVGADEVSDASDAQLDGEPARTYTYELAPEGEDARRGRQVVTVRDGAVYTVTYTALGPSFEEDADAFTALLDSWSWE